MTTSSSFDITDKKKALLWTMFWVILAILFNGLLWVYHYLTANIIVANKQALDFFTGYIIEKSLSLDNLFAFVIIFQQLKIPSTLQPRVLFYGIFGAIFMRLLMIFAGITIISYFHWVLYLMGTFLLITGIRIIIFKEKKFKNIYTMKFINKFFRVQHELTGNQFFVKKNGLYYVTPLFIALIFIEISDLIFATDSIPAIFAITQNSFIVWSSNIFAILGLRTLYFYLAHALNDYHLLKYGLASILVYVGTKMLIEPWLSIPTPISLGIIIIILIIFITLSRKFKKNNLQ